MMITRSIVSATSVFRTERRVLGDPGQVPEKTTTPRIETTDEARAKSSPGFSGGEAPQKTAAAARKPASAGAHRAISDGCRRTGREGVPHNHDRTATLAALERQEISGERAQSATACANACRHSDPAMVPLRVLARHAGPSPGWVDRRLAQDPPVQPARLYGAPAESSIPSVRVLCYHGSSWAASADRPPLPTCAT